MFQRHLIQLHHHHQYFPPRAREIKAIQSFTATIKWCEDQKDIFEHGNQTATHQGRMVRPTRTIKINGDRHKPKELYYNPDELNPHTNRKGVMKVGNEKVEAPIHGYTTRSKGQEGCRPRSIPSSDVVGMLNAPLVDETSGEVTRIQFKNGRENTVFFANGKSQCPILKRIFECFQEYGGLIEYLCKNIPPELWIVDSLAGGKYLPGGVCFRNGIQGSNPKLPFLRVECCHNIVKQLFDIYAQIIGLEALAIKKHCGDEYAENLQTYGDADDCIFPSPASQREGQNVSEGLHWSLHQVALRIMGRELNEESERLQRIAWHFDQGDVEGNQLLNFFPMGGKDGKGGRVADTDLMVFEQKYGGQCFRLRTTIEDTIVFILMNSAEQLHGNAKDEDDCEFDQDCWSARFIAFGRKNVLDFLNRRRNGKISGNAFWDIKLKTHIALQNGEFNVGDRVSGKFSNKLYDAKLIKLEGKHGLYFGWQDGRVTKCTKGSVFSRYCSTSEPHKCKHCNPAFKLEVRKKIPNLIL